MSLKTVTNTRSVRRLEKPRPLKFLGEQSLTSPRSPSVDNDGNINACDIVLQELEIVVKHLQNSNYDTNLSLLIIKVCDDLKTYGGHLEAQNDQLDRYFVTLRNAAGDKNLTLTCRIKLLELIELRASGWRTNENLANYYKSKVFEAETAELQAAINTNFSNSSIGSTSTTPLSTSSSFSYPSSNPSTPSTPVAQINHPALIAPAAPVSLVSSLSPGEILKSSGKFPRPTKVATKNYFKDEVIIRNADSGKVMGIKGRRVHMIEELSSTVISFQRVAQGAKDRPVQITGPNEDSIERAKQLIEDTIRRNASPIQNIDPNDESSIGRRIAGTGNLMHSLSMNDASIGEYQYTVTVGNDTIKISGSRLDIVRTARLVLEEYFIGDAERTLLSDDPADNDIFHEIDEEDEDEVFHEEDLASSEFIPISVPKGHEQSAPKQALNSTSKPEWLARNGHAGSGRILIPKLEEYSSSSDDDEDEDGTYKDDSTSESEDEGVVRPISGSDHKAVISGRNLAPRQVSFTNVQEVMEQNLATSDNKSRKVQFQVRKEKQLSSDTSTLKSPAVPPRKCYSRDFLLDCASLPLSQKRPESLNSLVGLDLSVILVTGQVSYFDGQAHKKLEVKFPVGGQTFPTKSTRWSPAPASSGQQFDYEDNTPE